MTHAERKAAKAEHYRALAKAEKAARRFERATRPERKRRRGGPKWVAKPCMMMTPEEIAAYKSELWEKHLADKRMESPTAQYDQSPKPVHRVTRFRP